MEREKEREMKERRAVNNLKIVNERERERL
jgi:hypothetical protein